MVYVYKSLNKNRYEDLCLWVRFPSLGLQGFGVWSFVLGLGFGVLGSGVLVYRLIGL